MCGYDGDGGESGDGYDCESEGGEYDIDYDIESSEEGPENDSENSEDLGDGDDFEYDPDIEMEASNEAAEEHHTNFDEYDPDLDIEAEKEAHGIINEQIEYVIEDGDDIEIGIQSENTTGEYHHSFNNTTKEEGAIHWHGEEFGPENEAEVPGLNLAINHEHTDEIEYEFKSDTDLEIVMEDDESKEATEDPLEETKGQKNDAKKEFYDSNSIDDVDPEIEYRDEIKRKEELES